MTLFFTLNIQAKDSTKVEPMEDIHFFQVAKNIFLEVLTEAIIGKILFDNQVGTVFSINNK